MPDPGGFVANFGLNASSIFQSCNGAFTPVTAQWFQQPTQTNFFTFNWNLSLDAAGTLTITYSGLSNTPLSGTWPTATSYSATENATWVFAIPTGAYTITQTDSQSVTFIDSSGNTATGTEVGSGGTNGVVPVSVTRTSVNIAATSPIIPSDSEVDESGKVLTRSNLTLTVTSGGSPVAGLNVGLQSNRGADDTITGPTVPTDASGVTKAKVETRKQPGQSTITSASEDIGTGSPAVITWLPARYESMFLVTCYVVSLESDFVSTPLIANVKGLPAENQYHSGFISDTRLQGSGIALDGSFIHYDGRGRYSLQSCPLMSNGTCAVDGTSAAVDPAIIPDEGTFSIDSVGARLAQDTGGAINGYHIDVYYGTRRKQCLAAGRRSLGVTFNNY